MARFFSKECKEVTSGLLACTGVPALYVGGIATLVILLVEGDLPTAGLAAMGYGAAALITAGAITINTSDDTQESDSANKPGPSMV